MSRDLQRSVDIRILKVRKYFMREQEVTTVSPPHMLKIESYIKDKPRNKLSQEATRFFFLFLRLAPALTSASRKALKAPWWTISYPDFSDFLASGWSPGEILFGTNRWPKNLRTLGTKFRWWKEAVNVIGL